MTDNLYHDVVIIGSGLAGLRAAISCAETNKKLSIGVISKVQVMRSHSVSAEGGTAAYFLKMKEITMLLIYTTPFAEVTFLQIKMLPSDWYVKCPMKYTNSMIGECLGRERLMVGLISATLADTPSQEQHMHKIK